MADSMIQRDIARLLFETGAIRVAPEDRPFWYASGTIGPYYSNTQNLIGSETEANNLLARIDSWLDGDRLLLPSKAARYFFEAYENNSCYQTVVDCIKGYLKNSIDMNDYDVVSGGARRDWFFSFITAGVFNKPHLTIFKDQYMTLSEPLRDGMIDGIALPVFEDGLSNINCLHVSDIITEASSYSRVWAPAARKAGAVIGASLTILDRLQGGDAALEALGIRHMSLAQLDAGFFDSAYNQRYIDARQYARLTEYIADPHGSMASFLKEHPDFVQNALAGGGKDAERARMCIESGVYGDAVTP